MTGERLARGRARLASQNTEATRNKILAAAARAFAARGFERATMNDIATEAGSTAPSLYTYFDGKQQILDGMLDDFSQSMLATFATEPSRSGSPKQKLEFLLRRQLRLIDEQRSVALVFAAERARASARSDRAFVLYVRALERWLRENLTAGYFGRFSPADAAFFIEGIAYAAFLRWADKGGKSRLERRASDVVSLFLFGVLGQDS